MSSGPAISQFLAALAAGGAVDLGDLYAADAVLDATVPNWRFTAHGPDAIAAQYAAWSTRQGCFEELASSEFPGGAVVTYLLTWEVAGVPHAAHRCHVLRLDSEGRIALDMVWCGGRWDAALLAEMLIKPMVSFWKN